MDVTDTITIQKTVIYNNEREINDTISYQLLSLKNKKMSRLSVYFHFHTTDLLEQFKIEHKIYTDLIFNLHITFILSGA